MRSLSLRMSGPVDNWPAFFAGSISRAGLMPMSIVARGHWSIQLVMAALLLSRYRYSVLKGRTITGFDDVWFLGGID